MRTDGTSRRRVLVHSKSALEACQDSEPGTSAASRASLACSKIRHGPKNCGWKPAAFLGWHACTHAALQHTQVAMTSSFPAGLKHAACLVSRAAGQVKSSCRLLPLHCAGNRECGSSLDHLSGFEHVVFVILQHVIFVILPE